MKVLLDLVVKPVAYLDPGSGSMLIQIVIAALLGAGVAIRVFWKNIQAFFTGRKSSDVSELNPTGILEDPTALPMDSSDTKE